MRLVVLVLSLLLMFAMAFVTAFGQTIRALSLFRPGRPHEASPVDWRGRILLNIYMTKLNLAFLLGIAVYLVTARTSHWSYGVAIVALCWIGSRLLPPLQWLRAESEAMFGLLLMDLEHRRERYLTAADSDRLHAVDALLQQIRSRHSAARPCR
jgi:hypothetical protein